MPNKTSFRIEWLKKKDNNGQLLEQWCEKRSRYEVFCRVCKKNIRCDNQGLNQLMKHTSAQTHVSLVKGIINGTQTILVKQPTESICPQEASASTLSCFSAKEEVIKAELLWALKVASSNFSYNSANEVSYLFREMFPDSIIASKFSVGHSKLYLITEATGPHFHEALLFDVKNSASPYTIEYDELTNKEIKKQLDLKIRYWSNSKNVVRVHHLDTFLMGQAKAHNIVDKIMQSLNDAKLPLTDLITLSSDGPNVNKAVFQKISEIKKSQHLAALLNVGFCNLHTVHNVFRKSVTEFGDEIVDLVVDLHYFFKQSPVRVEELKDLQDELGFKNLKLLKHVESRWLTPALDRLVNQWPVVLEYFLKRLPKRDPKISENARYLRIVKCLKRPDTTLVKIHFLLALSNTLQPFLAFFQREEPLIHLVYERMESLVRKLFSRFLKSKKIKNMSLQELQLLKFPAMDFELSDDELEVGAQSRKHLTMVKQTFQKELTSLMRRCLKSLAQGMLEKTLSLNIVVKEARCLKPENISKTWSLKAVKNLASNVQLSPPLNVDVVGDEWRVLQCETIPVDWYTYEIDDEVFPRRIDYFFSHIFCLKNDLGQEKYPELSRLLKVILVLPHGNADVERGFSQTSNFLTDSRTGLTQASISALQTTKDGLKVYDNKCHLVPIPREFIKKGAAAYKSYMERIEEEKRIADELKQQKEKEREQKEKDKKELERKKADMEKKTQTAKEAIRKEKSLEKIEMEATTEMDTYQTLVDEANERIKNALKNQDLKGVKIGQTMLEAACKKVQEGTSQLNQIRNEQKEIEKTKRTMLDFFCSSQNKKQKK